MTKNRDEPLKAIGFPGNPDEWREAEDCLTSERLDILGHPVMQAWEIPYMEKLAEIATSKGGVVLEVGFGMGLSAREIHKADIDEHIVIEPNKAVFTRLLQFKDASRIKVTPHLGFWEEVAPKLPDESIDGILFDPYPINAEQLYHQQFSFFDEAHRLLKEGGVFTHFSGEIEFTDEYCGYIDASGNWEYTGESVPVDPPEDCLYWTEKTILAPTLIKVKQG